MASDPFLLDAAIKELFRYSLIQRDAEQKLLRLHRLVQVVLKDAMDAAGRQRWAERAIRAVNRAFPDVTDVKLWEQCERYLPHALACVTLIEKYSLEFVEASRLLNRAAYYLYERARHPQAELLCRHALAICEQQLGPAHRETADILNNLVLLYYNQGRYEQAELLCRRALSIQEQQLGPEHPDTATSLNNLAKLYYEQGKYEQAEPLYQRAVAIRESSWGQSIPTRPPASMICPNSIGRKANMGKPSRSCSEPPSENSGWGQSTPTQPLASITWPNSIMSKANTNRPSRSTSGPWLSGNSSWGQSTPTQPLASITWPNSIMSKAGTSKSNHSCSERWRSGRRSWGQSIPR